MENGQCGVGSIADVQWQVIMYLIDQPSALLLFGLSELLINFLSAGGKLKNFFENQNAFLQS